MRQKRILQLTAKKINEGRPDGRLVGKSLAVYKNWECVLKGPKKEGQVHEKKNNFRRSIAMTNLTSEMNLLYYQHFK